MLYKKGVVDVELKTIEDIYPLRSFSRNIIRDEVRKWIKDMEAEQPYEEHTASVIIWARIFFNIGEEV